MKPSEYWQRQCYATYQSDPVGVKLLDEIGEDNIMWGSDFPHPDGIWPDSQEYIEQRTRPPAGRDPQEDRLRQRRQALPLRELRPSVLVRPSCPGLTRASTLDRQGSQLVDGRIKPGA